MKPTTFLEANTNHGPPAGVSEDLVKKMPSFKGVIESGPFNGTEIVVVAWKPTLEEIYQIIDGSPVYLAVHGGLPAHYIGVTFNDAVGL